MFAISRISKNEADLAIRPPPLPKKEFVEVLFNLTNDQKE